MGKVWCCQHGGHGCPTLAPVGRRKALPTTSSLFDCAVGQVHWKHGWSSTKKAWCCKHQNFACADTVGSTTPFFDCNAELAKWKHGWSIAKMAWCCAHENK